MIGIIDYGMGNLFSVSKALERLNVPYFISGDSHKLMKADGLILPGVGSFKEAMELLNRFGLAEMMKEYVQNGKPLLGICLGMQLLFQESEENGMTEGLKILPGTVKRFSGITASDERYKVPHMGWNCLKFLQSSPIFQDIKEDYVYFVHSYYVETSNKDVILAESTYQGEQVPAIVGKGNVFGMQFHPEKSGKLGMALLHNFTRLVRKG